MPDKKSRPQRGADRLVELSERYHSYKASPEDTDWSIDDLMYHLTKKEATEMLKIFIVGHPLIKN